MHAQASKQTDAYTHILILLYTGTMRMHKTLMMILDKVITQLMTCKSAAINP